MMDKFLLICLSVIRENVKKKIISEYKSSTNQNPEIFFTSHFI